MRCFFLAISLLSLPASLPAAISEIPAAPQPQQKFGNHLPPEDPLATSPSKTPYPWKTGIQAKPYTLPSLNERLFYVALPFDDLAHPDLAKKWLPPNWQTGASGKSVSACEGHWIQIKNAAGKNCYAPWRGNNSSKSGTGQASYVFGNDTPKGIGIHLSSEVIKYLSLDNQPGPVSWRFIDDTAVPPGHWLIFDEQALLLTAIQRRDAIASGKAFPSAPTASTALADKFLTAYLLINQAEGDVHDKKWKGARDTMAQAQAGLQEIQSIAPAWEHVLILSRLRDVTAKITDLDAKLSAAP